MTPADPTAPTFPVLSLGDPGFRWHHSDGSLQVSRRPTLVSVLAPTVVFCSALLFAWWLLQNGHRLSAGALGGAAIPVLGLIWFAFLHRVDATVDATGLHWREHRPDTTQGHWSVDRIDQVRVVLHPRSRIHSMREVSVEVRVDGAWQEIARGLTKRRAHAFAADVDRALGLESRRLPAMS